MVPESYVSRIGRGTYVPTRIDGDGLESENALLYCPPFSSLSLTVEAIMVPRPQDPQCTVPSPDCRSGNILISTPVGFGQCSLQYHVIRLNNLRVYSTLPMSVITIVVSRTFYSQSTLLSPKIIIANVRISQPIVYGQKSFIL